MQNVSFVISPKDRLPWNGVIKGIEALGYDVVFKIEKAKTTFVLGGVYINPMCFQGRKVLLAYPEEVGRSWETVYVPVLGEYYDVVVDVRKLPTKTIMDIIRGEIGVAK